MGERLHQVTRASPQFCHFRPQLFWQKVEAWHTCERTLHFRMNMTTEVNEARFSSTSSSFIEIEDNLERLKEAITSATRADAATLGATRGLDGGRCQ